MGRRRTISPETVDRAVLLLRDLPLQRVAEALQVNRTTLGRAVEERRAA
ncbi:hypothetical protein [Steroidobacter denitrificans]|nr:hypothetical protein [Steroidobacter denitrificans]